MSNRNSSAHFSAVRALALSGGFFGDAYSEVLVPGGSGLRGSGSVPGGGYMMSAPADFASNGLAYSAGSARLGLWHRSKRFTAALSLAAVLNMTIPPAVMAANITIGSGETSVGLTASSAGDTITVSGGGLAVSSVLSDSGAQSAFGQASGTLIKELGVEYVLNGGSATSSYISGIAASATSVTNSVGRQQVSSGGVAIGTIVTDYAGQNIFNGGVASGTFISGYGGSQIVSNGGIAYDTLVSSGGQYVRQGAASDTVLTGRGNQFVSSGGTALFTTANSGGTQYVSVNGTAVSGTVNSGGAVTVSSGGMVLNTTQNVSGNINVTAQGGDSAYASGQNASGGTYLLSGGTAQDFILYSRGTQSVSSGGTALRTEVNGGGAQYVVSGGVAVSASLSGTSNVHGVQLVSSGGTALDTNIEAAGRQTVGSGGYASGAVVSGLSGNSSGGYQFVYGGSADNTILQNSGMQYVSGGGVANSVTINSGAYQIVSAGGTAANARINSAGIQYVRQGMVVAAEVLSGGLQAVSSGATAIDTIVSSGGYQRIYENGLASGGSVLASGNQIVASDGKAVSAYLEGSGSVMAYQYVSEGGYAEATTIGGMGRQYVLSDGYASGAVVSGASGSNAFQYVYFTSADGTQVLGYGGQYVSGSGAQANGTYISGPGASMIVSVGAAASGTTAVSGGQYVRQGTAADTFLSGAGGQYVSSGGVASGTTVGDGARQYVYSSGVASGALIMSGGRQDVAITAASDDGSGALAVGTVISGGSQYVRSGGTALTTEVSAGVQYILSDGLASSANIYSGAGQYVSSGGTAGLVDQKVGGNIFVSVIQGDIVTDVSGVNVSGGFYMSGGVASNFIMYEGGSHVVSSGGTSIDLKVSSGGSLRVSNGVLRGSNYIFDGGQLLGPTAILENSAGLIMEVSAGNSSVTSTNLSGDGTLIKIGDGTLTLSSYNNLTGETQISGGVLQAGRNSAFGTGGSSHYNVVSGAILDLNHTTQVVGQIRGDGDTSIGSGSLTLNQINDVTYGGNFIGVGDLIKNDSGVLTLTAGGGSVGSAVVNGGGLYLESGAVLSALSGTVAQSGASIGGNGTFGGDVYIRGGGALAPNGPGYLSGTFSSTTVTGDLHFDSGASFMVDVDPVNSANRDQVQVNGTAYLAGTVKHLATGTTDTDYTNLDLKWTILSANMLSGSFAGAATNLVYLKPELEHDAALNEVRLYFKRSSSFEETGDTDNEKNTGKGLDSLDEDSQLIKDIINSTIDGDVSRLLNQLSGEIHQAALGQLLRFDDDYLRRYIYRSGRAASLRSRYMNWPGNYGHQSYLAPAAGQGPQSQNFWVNIGGRYSRMNSDGNGGRSTMYGPEVTAGYDLSLTEGWLAGLGLRYAHNKLELDSRWSEADIDTFGLSWYGGKELPYQSGLFRLMLGGSYMHHRVETDRQVRIGQSNYKLQDSYGADSIQLLLEGSYLWALNDCILLEPYLNLGWDHLRLGSIDEGSKLPALTASGNSISGFSTMIGLRSAAQIGEITALNFNLGWRHYLDTVTPDGQMHFKQGGQGFTIKGSTMNRDEAALGLGLAVNLTESSNLSINYDGLIGDKGQNHGGTINYIFKW